MISNPTPSAHSPVPRSPEAWEQARQLVLRYGRNATAYQILNPGFERWFSQRGDAVAGYVRSGGHRVVAGSPICAAGRLAGVVAELEEDTHGAGLRTCYFGAELDLEEELAARGPTDRLLLGAQPVWHPASFRRVMAGKASLRAQLYRSRNKGVGVSRWNEERARSHPELERCLDEWLDTRGLPPLHFLVEPETLGRLRDRRIFVAEQEGVPVAFLVASPIPLRKGWLVEQTVRGQAAPNGTVELLLDAAMEDLADGGAQLVTLGLVPLSRHGGKLASEHPWWMRALLGWMRAHGNRFYHFEGLDRWKSKFQPEVWEPVYAITSERSIGLGTLWAITGAFGKMSPPRLAFVALARALRQEWSWLVRGR